MSSCICLMQPMLARSNARHTSKIKSYLQTKNPWHSSSGPIARIFHQLCLSLHLLKGGGDSELASPDQKNLPGNGSGQEDVFTK